MALTYNTLIADKGTAGSLKNWLNYSLLPAEQIVTLAEAFIYERLRVREMRVEEPVTIALDASTLALPDRFLDPIELRLDGDGAPIDYVHENLLNRSRDEDGALYDGTISRYTIMDETIMFDVASDTARTGKFWFYQTPPALDGSAVDENFLTRRYPSLLIDVCNAYGNGHRKMFAERDKLLQIAAAQIADANAAAEMARRGQIMR